MAHAQNETITQEWEQLFKLNAVITSENVENVINGAVVDSNDDVIVTGVKEYGWPGTYYYYTIKYSGKDGNVLWHKSMEVGKWPFTPKVTLAIDSLNNVIVAGSAQNGTDTYYLTVKYSGTDGSILWEKFSTKNGVLVGVRIDTQNNVVVTATSKLDVFTSSYYTVKYNGVDGATLWEATYNREDFSENSPSDIAIDQSDNVIVTGTSNNRVSQFYYHTLKYRGTDGAILWEKSVKGSRDSVEESVGSQMSIDSKGDPILTFQDGGDYKTIKLATSDGATIWEKNFDGSDSITYEADSPKAIVIDSEDNVIVTGCSYIGTFEEPGNPDSYTVKYSGYTVKYSGIDGGILWQNAFALGVSAPPCPKSMVVDSQNNIIMAHSSIAKYSGVDGTILWRKPSCPPLSRIINTIMHFCFIQSTIAIDRSDNIILTGQREGDNYTFKYRGDEPLPPTIGTASASSYVRVYEWEGQYAGFSVKADLEGTISANGDITTTWVEYGPTKAYGNATTPVSIGSWWSSVPAGAHLSDLSPNTTYHFRLVASNIKGTIYGNDQIFTTPQVDECAFDNPPLYCTLENDGRVIHDGSGGGGCFIATAAYGSYLDPHVQILRDFRDKYLISNFVGRVFVKFYYKVSPSMAGYIKEHETLRIAARYALTPIVFGVEHRGIVFIIIVVLGSSFVAFWKIRKKL